ncbi:MAG: hypothetical protein OXQ29_20685 [Rhodospirillaceae bacterium]|nr:hypothetical protein [Rhodospirillaceae bacterium]
MAPLPRALALAVALLLLTITSASAQSSTPCLDAHAAFERSVGRPENAGLYERVYGDTYTAERRCQLEHAGQQHFVWFYAGYIPAPSPTPTPAPAVSSPPTGPPVSMPESAPAGPRVEAGLREAWQLIASLDVPSILAPSGLDHWDWDAVNRTRISWGDLDGAYGVYIRGSNQIIIDRGRFQFAPPWQVAALLAHELSHASIPSWQLSGSYNDCLWNEVLAFGTELIVGGELAELHAVRPTPIEGYFRDLLTMTLIWMAQADYSIRHGLTTPIWDKDLSDLPVLIPYLENERRYAQHCSR